MCGIFGWFNYSINRPLNLMLIRLTVNSFFRARELFFSLLILEEVTTFSALVISGHVINVLVMLIISLVLFFFLFTFYSYAHLN